MSESLEDIKVEIDLPELLEFGKASIKGCIVEKEIYEKWLPELKHAEEISWIVEEILEDPNVEPTQTTQNTHDSVTSENGQSKNAVVVREYTMTALPSQAGEKIEISNVIYPIVNDPFKMGQIACAALLNKLFTMKLFSCNRAVFMLAVCEKWTQAEQDNVERAALDGFRQTAAKAMILVNEAEVHTDTDCMIGGMLFTSSPTKLYGFPNESIIGDVIVLTKPLGVQITLDAQKIFQQGQSEIKDRIGRIISAEDMSKAYDAAINLMTTLNVEAIKLTDNFVVHAATAINGHSLMEHAQMLAEKQLNEVAFYIYNLPVIAKMLHVSKVLGSQMDLIQGNIPEISGGLFLVMPREQAAGYCRHLLNEGSRAWIIGVVEKGEKTANMIKKARIIDWLWKSEVSG